MSRTNKRARETVAGLLPSPADALNLPRIVLDNDKEKILIGSSGIADYQLEHPGIERYHVELRREGERWVLENLGLGEVSINQKPIYALLEPYSETLEDKDIVDLGGGVRWQFREDIEAATPRKLSASEEEILRRFETLQGLMLERHEQEIQLLETRHTQQVEELQSRLDRATAHSQELLRVNSDLRQGLIRIREVVEFLDLEPIELELN